MSRVVAFEGPDLTGKTSLLEVLQQRMPFAMWPRLSYSVTKEVLTEPGGKTLDETVIAFHEGLIVASKQMPFMLDRCYVSSYIYGRVFQRQVDLAKLSSVATRLRPFIVYVDTPTSVLLERLKWRGDDFIGQRVGALTKIAEYYREWARINPFGDKILQVSTELYPTKETIVDKIEVAIKEEMGL